MKPLPIIPECSRCENVKDGSSAFSECAFQKFPNCFPDKKFYIYKSGEYLFKKNQPVEGIYCIYSGKVKVYKDKEIEKDDFVQTMATGEIVGLHSVGKAKHVNSAIVNEISLVCFFPLSEIRTVKQVLSSINKSH